MLNPQATNLFATQGIAGFATDTNLGAPNNLFKGFAQITSTQKTLMCTAFLTDVSSGPPQSMVSLTIISKTKQKGD